ncbi:hypothetical protein QBC45DRAFT_311479, partial [Copromyces sp. CBS 386.78]
MSSPLKVGGFYYDALGYIQPRRYFDHSGCPLPGNTNNTSYSPIRLSSPLQGRVGPCARRRRWSTLSVSRQASAASPSNPTTLTTKPKHLVAKYGRKEPSLRLRFLRKKAKKVYDHVLELARLAHQVQKMMTVSTTGSRSGGGHSSGRDSGS